MLKFVFVGPQLIAKTRIFLLFTCTFKILFFFRIIRKYAKIKIKHIKLIYQIEGLYE